MPSQGLALAQSAVLLAACIPPTASAQSDPSAGTLTVKGRVVNALSGTPIPRVLVNLNSRAVMTDALGHFEFPAFSANPSSSPNSTQGWVKIMKPGYSSALDATEAMSQQPVFDLTAPLELKLYPDALITGTVTGTDRQPIPKVQMSLYREMGDEAARQLVPVAGTQTDSRGEYRFGVGGGRFAVLLRYTGRGEAGEVILPQRFPDSSGSDTSRTFVVHPGEERKIDLQARTGPAYLVSIQVDGDSDRGNVRIQVKGASGAFTVFARPGREPGEYTFDLPSGSYQLHATQQSRDHRLEAEGQVTVAGRPVTGLTMHFIEVPLIPIQISMDATAVASGAGTEGTSPLPPTAQAVGLYLRRVGGGEDEMNDVRPTQLPDKNFAIQPGSGSYRLESNTGGMWFVEKASYGTTDLLTEPLVVAPGAGGGTIQIVASNGYGQVTGVLRRNGTGAPGFVYFLPQEPSLTPLYTAQARADGTYTERLPPGNYTVVGFDHRYPGNLRATAGQITGSAATQVSNGAKAVVDLVQQTQDTVQ